MRNNDDRSQNGHSSAGMTSQSGPKVVLNGRWGAPAGRPRLVTFSWGAVAPSQWTR